jgi:hypothetical protein
MKNLIISAVGNESIHKNWLSNYLNYDIFLINYGEKDYSNDCKFYIDKAQGSKYNLIYENKSKIFNIIDDYKNVFLPDDDILISPNQIKKLFNIHSRYDLLLSMPALTGPLKKYDKKYIEVPIFYPDPDLVLKYTNWVGIICPCFSISFFKQCIETFNYNKSNWGIAFLWSKLIEKNKKIAIIDSIEAIHTKELYVGENYRNNLDYKDSLKELTLLCQKNKINMRREVIEKMFKIKYI